jgi:hypothetical protein
MNRAFIDVCHNACGKPIPGDNNNCTVHAFAAAFNVTREAADAHVTKLGRKRRRGFNTHRMMTAPGTQIIFGKVTPIQFERPNVILGYDYGTGRRYSRREGTRKSDFAHMRVSTFLKKHAKPGARYVVNVSGHAFAVIDRRVRDYSDHANRILKYVFEVEPHLNRPGAINLPVLASRRLEK